MDAIDVIRGGQLPEASVSLCMRGDLQAQLEQLERDLRVAEDVPLGDESLAGNSKAREIAQQIRELQGRMREHVVVVRLRAMRRPAYRELVASHPPRRTPDGEVHNDDKHVGVNMDEWPTAIIRRCIVEPVLDDETWDLLINERLTDRQFDQLYTAAHKLNRGDVDVPFSRAALRVLDSASE